MSIIGFIDWDGVLNTFDLASALSKDLHWEFYKQENSDPLSPASFGLLNRLCLEHPEIRIVCSSV